MLLYITSSIYFRKCKVNFLSDSIRVIPFVPPNILVVVSVAEVLIFNRTIRVSFRTLQNVCTTETRKNEAVTLDILSFSCQYC